MNSLQKLSQIIFIGLLVTFFLLPSFNADAQYVRSRHDSKVNQFAQKAARSIQENICPTSGSNASASVQQWVYDEYQDHYEINVSINWTGRTWAFGENQTFRVSGLLIVTSSGRQKQFKQSYANDAVTLAQRNTNIAVGAVIVGALLASESQN